jgi:hypothetical protein
MTTIMYSLDGAMTNVIYHASHTKG